MIVLTGGADVCVSTVLAGASIGIEIATHRGCAFGLVVEGWLASLIGREFTN